MAESLLAAVRHAGGEEPVRTLLSASHVAAEVNKLGATGVNALGLAVWRNHAGLVEALLEAGADPDTQDTESGWSALHRALHWGQLRVAAALLQADASVCLHDWRGRSPLDLLSAELKEYLEPGDGDVFSWGNGSNYTLGTGSTDMQLHPARIDSLHDQQVVSISAAKFHSAAVTVDGHLLTWGWGRGGRLGHPEASIHSGEGAVISPHIVSSLGKRQAAAVAAGKHHTVLVTTAGEVFTMGSNRHGQLGYAVDSQPTPRRVSSLRQRVVAVAAANKHSVAVTSGGDVFTWGSNVLGQLGYGTSDSNSNAAPRLVEAMKGKPVAAAAAAKRHTLVLTAAGEVYTWGHRGVSPRRVQLAGVRDLQSAHGAPISFHRGHAEVTRPLPVAICAGAAHSSVLTATGVALSWRSADPALQVQEVGGVLAGKRLVSMAAGKYRTATVSDEGDVFMWEGRSDYFPAEGRQPGSGSKKPGGSATKARPIPGGSGGCGTRISLGGEVPLGGSYGSGEVSGSFGSHNRRPGSFIERFGREREAGFAPGPGSFGAGSGGRFEMSEPGAKGGRGGGDVFEKIKPQRVDGLKRAVAVAVGEKHSLAVQRWSAAQLEGTASVPWLQQQPARAGAPAAAAGAGGWMTAAAAASAADEDQWDPHAADGWMGGSQLTTPRSFSQDVDSNPGGSPASTSVSASPGKPSPVRPGPQRARAPAAVGVPTLQRMCEEEVARRLVDPRTCLQVLEYADVAGAELLRAYCLAVAVCNLDAVLLEACGAFEQLPPHLLAELERLFKLRMAGAGSSSAAAEPSALQGAGSSRTGSQGQPAPRPGSRLQPGRRPTAAGPWLAGEGLDLQGLPPGITLPPAAIAGGGSGGSSSSFRDRSQVDAEVAVQRLLRMLQKKLQQIEHLEHKAAQGFALDVQQQSKLEQKPVILSAAAALDGGMALDDVHSILQAAAVGAGGREAAEQFAGGGSQSSSKAAAAGAAATPSGKPPKGKGSKKSTLKPVDAASASGSGINLAATLAAEASSSLLGSSPPASSLVPAFGQAGSAEVAAEQPGTPAAASEPPSTPGQVRSLVGFASSSASDGVGAAAQQDGQQPLPGLARPTSSSKPKSRRKGGLSMFLRGELEQATAAAAAATSVAAAAPGGSSGVPPAPAWGSKAAAPAGATSLKQILDQEAAAPPSQPGSAAKPAPPSQQSSATKAAAPAGQRGTPGSGAKSRSAVDSPSAATAAAGPVRLSLASFMQTTSPMAVQRRESASPPPPAWGGAAGAAGAAGASPPGRHSSFRAIQEEQETLYPAKSLGASPPAVQRLAGGMPPWRAPPLPPGATSSGGGNGGAAAAGGALLGTSPSGTGSLLGTSPSGRGASFLAAPMPQHSKWYVPEESKADRNKSLKSIQTEEVAMQEFAKRFGSGNVRLVAKDRRSPGLPRPSKQGNGGSGSGSTGGPPPQQGMALQQAVVPQQSAGKQQAGSLER